MEINSDTTVFMRISLTVQEAKQLLKDFAAPSVHTLSGPTDKLMKALRQIAGES